ncbi:hypothetical protein BKA65DRAFT_250700 [Rhexocercosporidium sp. MPI-PUGE-AT-0058]|nr:hypothetical protein BKA65DRAFT_250700 [Rhexocercosporidium sp. MPI-PUGE-AT-0058]
MGTRERLRVFLEDKSERTILNLPSQKVVNTSAGIARGYRNRPAPVPSTSPTDSSQSSVSSSSRRSDSISRRSSASSSSEAPSIHIAPPWYRNPPATMTPLEYTYDLPCEFAEMFDCGVTFHPERFEEWVQHGASHFMETAPPPTTVCIFCDGTVFQNYRDRMIHIGSHYQDNATLQHSRPDYFVIKQLYQGQLLSKEDYDFYMEYTERPLCANLVEYGFKTPEAEARERQDEPRLRHEFGNKLVREERRIRRDKGKEGSGTTYKPYGKNKIIYQEPRS